MNFHSAHPYSSEKHGIPNFYPSLDKNENTEVAIIGAGITGALVAYHLCKAGIGVIIVDKRHAAQGSTAASTSLLQYELDVPLTKLIPMIGEKPAVRTYELCVGALHKLEQLSRQLNRNPEFMFKPSFQFASYKKDVKNLKMEFNLRKQYNISSVHWFERDEIYEKFGFESDGGLFSSDGAEVDAYLLAHSLLASSVENGLKIHENTEVVEIEHHKHAVDLLLGSGKKITTKKLIICCGYESYRYIPKRIGKPSATYAIISESMSNQNFWYNNSLIWETAVPYLYLRITTDNRIIIGGKDDQFHSPAKRDMRLPAKRESLEKSFKKLFPQINFKTDFAWAGTFCTSADGLPYIGSIPQRPNTYFALGYGGNGITFSLIAAEIIRDVLIGKTNNDLNIFSFTR